jgi:hypothetical protein
MLRYGVCAYCGSEARTTSQMIVLLGKQKAMIKQLRHERRLLKFQLQTAKAKLARAKSSP